MHAMMRYYAGPGSKELADLLEKNKSTVELAMKATSHLHSYTLIRLPDACVSITVCHDKAGCDDSAKRAAAWIKENGGGLKVNPPMVSEGAVIVHVK
jgi:hypothetical protein